MNDTIEVVLRDATRQMEEAGITSARLDASLLLCHILGMERGDLLLNHSNQLNNNDKIEYSALVARRLQNEPVAYITGKKEFWSLDFCVTRDTLIPRPDSETLVEAALKRVQSLTVEKRALPITIVDVGTGTGCLLIALLKEFPDALGIGIDKNERALQVAKRNAKKHGVSDRAEFVLSHWCSALHGTFDLIISNPPYIQDTSDLMADVAHYEPHDALFAGADGLDAYRALAPQMQQFLKPGGYVVFEVGQGQAEAVATLLQSVEMRIDAIEKDLAGIPRCVVACKIQ